MIEFNIENLLRKKAYEEERKISLNILSNETGISLVTLTKIVNQKDYSTGSAIIDKLCNYFQCNISDIMKHVPDYESNSSD